MSETQASRLLPPSVEMQRAFATKDASYDGVFYAAVKTTGIFCRPSCPSKPKPENIEFFSSVRECLFAGYRPCKRCRPQDANGAPPPWIVDLMKRIEDAPDVKMQAVDLRALGVSPERARRWFQQHHGMTFAAWQRGHRLASAFTQIRNGASLDDATLDSGFESHSGFRDAFARVFGNAPGKMRKDGQCLITAMVETPLGPMIAVTSDAGVCLLEFTDRRMLERNLRTLRQRFQCAIVPGAHCNLDKLRMQLAEYFSGTRHDFQVPLDERGTPFQEKVWRELRRIPSGVTLSYEEVARRLGQPSASRAVALANGMNRIYILTPCHRVVAKDGGLSGYGGGVWRKRLLLDMERRGTTSQLP